MSDLSTIERHFNDQFRRYGIHLPPADLALRRRGRLDQAGWTIWYLFGRDDQGDYLDFYATHRQWADMHRRLRARGGRECLPALQEVDPDSLDPAEVRRLRAACEAVNRPIAALLAAKGFSFQPGETLLAALDHQSLTHPPALAVTRPAPDP